MAAEAEVAQAVAGKAEADIAVAEQGPPLVAALTRTQLTLTTTAPLAGKPPIDLLCVSPVVSSQTPNVAPLVLLQLHSVDLLLLMLLLVHCRL